MHQLPPLDLMDGRYAPGMFDPNLMTPGPPSGSGHGQGPGPGPGPSSTPYLPPPTAMPGYSDYPFDNQWQPYLPHPQQHPGPGPGPVSGPAPGDFGQHNWYMPGPSHPPSAPLPSQSNSPYPPMRGSIHSVQSHPSPQMRDEGPKKKKKRKGEESPGSAEDKEKRTKTGRACDACVSTVDERADGSGRKRSASTFSSPTTPCARTASSTTSSARSTCPSPRRGSRRRGRTTSGRVRHPRCPPASRARRPYRSSCTRPSRRPRPRRTTCDTTTSGRSATMATASSVSSSRLIPRPTRIRRRAASWQSRR